MICIDDLQREIIEQPEIYGGMFMKNDKGDFLEPNGGMRIWDFRNQSAIDWHTKMVTGYFATNASSVDAVFFVWQPTHRCPPQQHVHLGRAGGQERSTRHAMD